MRKRRCVALAAMLLTANAPDSLYREFRDPPPSARPRVWWHWMDGNVSADGARRDLDWMKSVGIGGVHLFEAGMGTPTIVPRRVTFMSPEWAAALRASAAHAKALGLEFGIATSAGWSATGGPEVAPADAMKKLVWTRTDVTGGGVARIVLTRPSDIAGPYQDVPLAAVEPGAAAAPILYRDARVLAFPASVEREARPERVTSSAGSVDRAGLGDGRFGPAQNVVAADGMAWIDYAYDRSTVVRSIVLGLPGPRGFGAPKAPLATLEASDDGAAWRMVVALPPSTSPVRSASFPAVAARQFRVRIVPDPAPGFTDKLGFAPGAVRPPFPTGPAASYAISELVLSGESRVSRAEEKAGFATVPDYYAIPTPPARGIDPAQVMDLTGRLRSDGTLDWTPPPGRWTILRLGWSLTGHRNGPAPPEATGLEVDKLEASRVRRYINAYLDRYRAALGGDLAASGVNALLSDSIEAGPQTWTETLPDEFRRRRGYDPTPWLPALTGAIVGDAARSDRFLWDWRRTIAELYADAHYSALAAAAKAHGLAYSAEALEDHRPQLGDDLAMRARAEVPTGAMWAIAPGDAPNPTYVADLKGAASVANLYGKRAVAAESFTAFGRPWAFAPDDLKATADLELALGVTRFMIHTSAHQPLADWAPGLALAPALGQYFTRNETWAPFAKPWLDYLARGSFLLSQGHHAADIAYFYGEEAPITGLYGDAAPPDIPVGHDYDFVNAEALARFTVRDGRLFTPNGQSYRLIQLGGSSRLMTLATIRRLTALVAQGAVLVGRAPLKSPSLADDDVETARAIAALWGGDRPMRRGRGMVWPLADPTPALAALGLAPDWSWDGAPARLAVIHRVLADGDVWFVSNQGGAPVRGRIALRAAGRMPELWRAETGERTPLSLESAGGITRVPLALAANGSAFLVLREPAHRASVTVAPPRETVVREVGKGWTLAFAPGRGAPAGETDIPKLGRWDQAEQPGVRYFSGIGTYRTMLDLAKMPRGRLWLDLGTDGDVAQVEVDGRVAGVAWTAPYRVEVTGLLHAGRNRLIVRVADLWVNRLIGDQQPGAVKIAHVTGPTYRADAPLRMSGLAGPVRLIATSR